MDRHDGISRRDLLTGLGLRRKLAARLDPAEPATTASERRPVALPIHRPPGAVDEARFLQRCTRCGDCSAACPHDAIIHAPARFRHAAGTPMIDPAAAPCHMCPDTPCIASCPTGALLPGRPMRMATAFITPIDCIAHGGRLCTVCSERCPVTGAIVLDHGRPRIDPYTCTGCGVCHHVCPAPTNAIAIMPLPDRPA